jgi:hydrogenase maturation factor
MNNGHRNIFSVSFCQPDSGQHCPTCADEAIPMSVILIDEQVWLAMVEAGDQREEIDITLVEQVSLGDILLVHGGVAIARQEEGDIHVR